MSIKRLTGVIQVLVMMKVKQDELISADHGNFWLGIYSHGGPWEQGLSQKRRFWFLLASTKRNWSAFGAAEEAHHATNHPTKAKKSLELQQA
jgi:hypothetical protein